MSDLVKKLLARTVRRLPKDWKKGRKCPDCKYDADRPKCAWDEGPNCARHDPELYDPSPFIVEPDKDCAEAATELTRLHEQCEAKDAEIERLKETYRTIVLARDGRIDSLSAENERLRKALVGTIAALAAAISLLSRSSKKAAASDAMFDMMLKDYGKALDAGRAALAAHIGEGEKDGE